MLAKETLCDPSSPFLQSLKMSSVQKNDQYMPLKLGFLTLCLRFFSALSFGGKTGLSLFAFPVSVLTRADLAENDFYRFFFT